MSQTDGRHFRRRVRVVLFLFLAGLMAVAVRVFQLQVVRHEELARVARDEYLNDVRIPARRGNIYDRTGKPLAISVDVPSVYANPSVIEDPRQSARVLAKELSLDLDSVYQRLASDRLFVWLKRQVPPDVAERVQKLNLKGVAITKEPRRYYPNREIGAHVIGFTGVDASGLEGIERQLEDELAGEPRVVAAVRDARGNAVLEGDLDPEGLSNGADVHLTLDVRIQDAAQSALERAVKTTAAKSGVAVVLEVPTAEVLAIAVEPVFNPNRPSEAAPEVRRNRAIVDMFEPGSTFKPLVVAAALEAGTIAPGATFFCENGRYEIGDRTIRDSKQHGWLDVTGIIAKSSNIGAAKIGATLGRDRLAAVLRRFGIGERTGVTLPGETAGSLREPSSWSKISLATISYGHGVAVNALQLAVAYRALASGQYDSPQLVRSVARADRVEEPVHGRSWRVLDAKTVKRTTAMLEKVVSSEGTGGLAAVPGYRVAGKTGTAYKVDPVSGGYSSDRYLAVFAGFIPAEAPRVVIVVTVDEPRQAGHTGGEVAAPVFAEIGEATMRYLGVIPTKALSSAPPPAVVAERDAEVAPLAEETPPAGAALAAGDDLIPSFLGLTPRQVVARYAEAGLGLELEIQGSGRVVEQVPVAGSGRAEAQRLRLVLQ